MIKHYAPLMTQCQNKCAVFDLDFWVSQRFIKLILIGNGLNTIDPLIQ